MNKSQEPNWTLDIAGLVECNAIFPSWPSKVASNGRKRGIRGPQGPTDRSSWFKKSAAALIVSQSDAFRSLSNLGLTGWGKF